MNIIEKCNPTTNLDDLQRMARMFAASGYFDAKGAIETQIAQIATKMLAGAELGFGPFASVNGIQIIQGKPSIAATLMASAVKGSGRYDYRVREMSSDRCSIEFFERIADKKESIGVSEFTREDAARAGTQNMVKYARNMLFARAMSNGVRWFCPDTFSGSAVYVPEEFGAEVDGDGNIVSAMPRHIDPSTGEIMASDADEGDALFTPEQRESPPHQRMFGQGASAFGPDWDKGARAWLCQNWTEKVAKTEPRDSAAQLSDDEKDILADYIRDNLAGLQTSWRNHKAAMLQSTGARAQQPATNREAVLA